MNVKLHHPVLSGNMTAPSSKSLLHRALLLSAFADKQTEIFADTVGDDVQATIEVLRALGCKIIRNERSITVTPTKDVPDSLEVSCRESASTLRFFIPVLGALGVSCRFLMQGNLKNRPITAYTEALSKHGVTVSQDNDCVFVEGKLSPGTYVVNGALSSQFVSGMLMALPMISGECELCVSDTTVSAPYVALTEKTLSDFGVTLQKSASLYRIQKSSFHSPGTVYIEGDYSSAAPFLVGGAIGRYPITVTGLSRHTAQGDAAVLRYISSFGAKVEQDEDGVTVTPRPLTGIDVDLSDTPDLFPSLCVLAACAEGQSRFFGVARLMYKESDRIFSVRSMLQNLGIRTEFENGVFTVFGGKIHGGVVDSFGDHRIAMSAAVLACRADGPLIVQNANCVKKSYPDFFSDFQKLTKTESLPCLFLSENI